MEFSNEGASVYHNVQAVYVRGADGRLNRITGPKQHDIQTVWQQIQPQLCNSINPKRLEIASQSDGSTYHLLAHEVQRQGEDDILGIILRTSPNAPELPFQTFFASLLLTQMRLDLNETCQKSEPSLCQQATEAITDLFDLYFRHIGINDQWNNEGRKHFLQRVNHYTSRNAKVEFCLPAFPCKSSNPEKVMGTMPDRGEELALRRLHYFVQQIEAVYKPGAKVWIISDGHVFSDCIGVDDDGVDRYSAQLIEMNNIIASDLGCQDRVGFKSLVDLFDLKSSMATISNLSIPEIDHFLDTKMTDEAELCRRVLMAGCQPDKAALRQKIDSKDAAIVALYRGFSRFMLEDLDLHPSTQKLSRSQRKKLATKVSFEMIARNQAYSNLVELLFPDHVRLSIHAHSNSGPKFGIQLFDKALSRVVRTVLPSADSDAASSVDLLHIPTAWHNCVFQFADSPIIYVAKAKIVRDALNEGLVTGGWIEGTPGKGGYFELRRVEPEEQEVYESKERQIYTPNSVDAAKIENRGWGLRNLLAKTDRWAVSIKVWAVYLSIWASVCAWMKA